MHVFHMQRYLWVWFPGIKPQIFAEGSAWSQINSENVHPRKFPAIRYCTACMCVNAVEKGDFALHTVQHAIILMVAMVVMQQQSTRLLWSAHSLGNKHFYRSIRSITPDSIYTLSFHTHAVTKLIVSIKQIWPSCLLSSYLGVEGF